MCHNRLVFSYNELLFHIEKANYAGQDGKADKLHAGTSGNAVRLFPAHERERLLTFGVGHIMAIMPHIIIISKLSRSLTLTYEHIMMNNRPSQMIHNDSTPIMIYGELSSDDDGCLSSSSHDVTKSRASTERHGRKPAVSLEVSDLSYFTELYAELQMVDGIEELNNKLSLVTQITRDRADEGKRNASKMLLRRRIKKKTIGQRGNTENTRIDPKPQEHTEADSAAGAGVLAKTTPVRDESRV